MPVTCYVYPYLHTVQRIGHRFNSCAYYTDWLGHNWELVFLYSVIRNCGQNWSMVKLWSNLIGIGEKTMNNKLHTTLGLEICIIFNFYICCCLFLSLVICQYIVPFQYPAPYSIRLGIGISCRPMCYFVEVSKVCYCKQGAS